MGTGVAVGASVAVGVGAIVGSGITVAVGGGAAVVGMTATVAVGLAAGAGSPAQARPARSRITAIHTRGIGTSRSLFKVNTSFQRKWANRRTVPHPQRETPGSQRIVRQASSVKPRQFLPPSLARRRNHRATARQDVLIVALRWRVTGSDQNTESNTDRNSHGEKPPPAPSSSQHASTVNRDKSSRSSCSSTWPAMMFSTYSLMMGSASSLMLAARFRLAHRVISAIRISLCSFSRAASAAVGMSISTVAVTGKGFWQCALCPPVSTKEAATQ